MNNNIVWLAVVCSFQGGHSLIGICDTQEKAIQICENHEYSANGQELAFDSNNSAFGKDANNRYLVLAKLLNEKLYDSDLGSY